MFALWACLLTFGTSKEISQAAGHDGTGIRARVQVSSRGQKKAAGWRVFVSPNWLRACLGLELITAKKEENCMLSLPCDTQAMPLLFIVVQLLSHVCLFVTPGLRHAKLPCPSLYPRICSKLGPLSQWCNLANSSSVTPSPPAFSLSQYLGLFQWVSSLHQAAEVVELQLQHQSFQWILRTDFL